jgi:uncharacterized protein (TIGR02285 family)
MQKSSIYYLFIALYLCSPIIFAQQKTGTKTKPTSHQEIIWLVSDTYKWNNYKQGVSVSTPQDTAAIIIENLKSLGYSIVFVKASGKRINHFLKNNPNTCVSNRVKTLEREKAGYFSTPHDIFLSQKLYRKKSVKPLPKSLFNDKGEIISLTTLFEFFPNHLLTLSAGTSYGEEIDKQVKQLKNKNLFMRIGSLPLQSISKMMFKNRTDYAIFYPDDMGKLLKQSKQQVESYKLQGTPSYIKGYVHCAKTEIGEQVIKSINNILSKAYKTPAFLEAHTKWVLPSDLPLLKQYFKEVFID